MDRRVWQRFLITQKTGRDFSLDLLQSQLVVHLFSSRYPYRLPAVGDNVWQCSVCHSRIGATVIAEHTCRAARMPVSL